MLRIEDVLLLRPKFGEVGLEIELEGKHLPDGGVPGWRFEHDGSLRGESIEAVFDGPAPRWQVRDRLNDLTQAFVRRGSRIPDEMPRAGVHVHVNMQGCSVRHVCNFITLYLVFENTLVKWCGKDRSSNLFCLRTDDAPGALPMIRSVFTHHNWDMLMTDEHRYASMNLKALPQYGSLEFRAMRSTVEFTDVGQWVSMLLRLKDKASEYDSPASIVEQASRIGIQQMFEDVLGSFKGLEFNPHDIVSGIRNAQQVAYHYQEPGGRPPQDEAPELQPVQPVKAKVPRFRIPNRAWRREGGVMYYKGCDNIWRTRNEMMSLVACGPEDLGENLREVVYCLYMNDYHKAVRNDYIPHLDWEGWEDYWREEGRFDEDEEEDWDED